MLHWKALTSLLEDARPRPDHLRPSCRRHRRERKVVGGVVAGFVTIMSIIGLGILLAQLKILDAAAQQMLTRLTPTAAAACPML